MALIACISATRLEWNTIPLMQRRIAAVSFGISSAA
jgi:hypothetical protein